VKAEAPFRAGFAAVVGRSNVGKSTLVNALVGARVTLVSRRPQSTRRRVLGVVNRPHAQLVLADCPGLHASRGRALNRALNRGALEPITDADVVLLVTEAGYWGADDDRILDPVRTVGRPVVLALNKIDRIRSRAALLPFIEEAAARHDFAAVVPVSARRGENVERLAAVLEPFLPECPAFFPPDQLSDQPLAEQAAETVREALFERLGEELPYSAYVTVERHAEEHGRLNVEATIWVARESQKGIVVGAGGRMTKAIGTAARLRL
jgi:GTPase